VFLSLEWGVHHARVGRDSVRSALGRRLDRADRRRPAHQEDRGVSCGLGEEARRVRCHRGHERDLARLRRHDRAKLGWPQPSDDAHRRRGTPDLRDEGRFPARPRSAIGTRRRGLVPSPRSAAPDRQNFRDEGESAA